MDPTLLLKSAVCALAIVGAVVLAALGQIKGPEALDFSKWALGFWVGAATISAAVTKWAASKNPVVTTLEQLAAPLEPAPTTAKSAPRVPPLPLLALLLVLVGCTPSERATAATAARMAVPACEAGLTLLAEAPELAPFCAAAPEVEAAVAELVAEWQAAHPGTPAPGPTLADRHRRVHARRHRTTTAAP